MRPYETAASLLRTGSVFKHLSDINTANVLFHQILPLLPFEPIHSARLQKSLMSDFLRYLQDATSTYFATKYQALQDAQYISHDIQDAKSSHYFIKNIHSFHKICNYKNQTRRAFLSACNNSLNKYPHVELLSTHPFYAPGQYNVSVLLDDGLIPGIIVGIIPDISFSETSYIIHDAYVCIYSTMARILLDTMKDKLQS